MSKFVHPDVVVGEVVPEVEPRVDVEMLGAVRKLNRWAIWFGMVYLVVMVWMAIMKPGFGVLVVVMLGGVSLWAIPFVRQRKALKNYQADPWCIPFRDALGYRLNTSAAGGMWFVAMFVSDGVSRVIGFGGLMILLLGGALIGMVRKASEPGQICCVDCNYPLVGLTLPIGCPECGRMIYDGSWTTDRVRVRSGWFVYGGVGLILVGCVVMYTSFMRPGLMYGPMPRGVLMQLAATDEGAFGELVGRSMSAGEVDELIEAVIAGNEGGDGWGYQSRDQEKWLTGFVGTGRISWGQYDRMYSGVGDPIRIESPGVGRVGEAFDVRLISEYVSMANLDGKAVYFFRGFVVDDAQEPVGGGDYERYIGFLDNDASDLGFRHVPRVTVTPRRDGELVIRGRVVVAFVPRGSGVKMKIDWDQDEGSMFVPALEWYRVIDLEYVVEVER